MYLWIALIGVASFYCFGRLLLGCLDEEIQSRWKNEAPHSTPSRQIQPISAQVSSSAQLRLT